MKHKLEVYPAILGRNDLPPVVPVVIPKIVPSQETGIKALKFNRMRITMRIANIAMDVLMPTVRFSGQQYALLTPQMAAVHVRLLSGPIGTLEHSRSEVLAALDFAISGNQFVTGSGSR